MANLLFLSLSPTFRSSWRQHVCISNKKHKDHIKISCGLTQNVCRVHYQNNFTVYPFQVSQPSGNVFLNALIHRWKGVARARELA